MLDRQQALRKKGILSDGEIKSLVKEWHDVRTEAELNSETVEMEMRAMAEKLRKYNVERLGDLPSERDDGTMRILVCQMGGCASKETREIKMAATEKLIRTYDINLCAFMELNFNWSKVNSSANLASWLQDEERDLRSITAHNTSESDETLGKHQPGGTHPAFAHRARKPLAQGHGIQQIGLHTQPRFTLGQRSRDTGQVEYAVGRVVLQGFEQCAVCKAADMPVHGRCARGSGPGSVHQRQAQGQTGHQRHGLQPLGQGGANEPAGTGDKHMHQRTSEPTATTR